jgi:putative transposase
MAQFNITITEKLLHGLFLSNGRDEAFSKLLEEIFNQVLLAQSSEQVGAEPYERTEERTAYRNGFRDRQMTTRVGTLTLRVPRHRNGKFSTELFARYQRSEQALILAMMEMVINGVSTRKVEAITQELCGKSFSKSTVSALCKQLDPMVHAFRTRPLESHYPFLIVDALYLKVREDHRVESRGLLIAVGVNEEGYREIIGFQVANTETESSWGEFFASLKERGLKDVRLITSMSVTIKSFFPFSKLIVIRLFPKIHGSEGTSISCIPFFHQSLLKYVCSFTASFVISIGKSFPLKCSAVKLQGELSLT